MTCSQHILVRLDDRQRAGCIGVVDEASARAHVPLQISAADTALDEHLVEQAAAVPRQSPQPRKVTRLRPLGRLTDSRVRTERRESSGAAETQRTHEPMDRVVVVGRVETRHPRAELFRARDPVRDKRTRGASTAETRVDAEPVQPGFVIAEKGQLRDADRSTVDGREPEATAAIADPLVEDLRHIVIAAPDVAADLVHRAFVRGRGAANGDVDRADHVV